MSDSMHQRRSPTAHNVAPDAVEQEFNHPAIDLNRPDLNDPREDQDPDSSDSDCWGVVSVDQSGLALVPVMSSGLSILSQEDMVYRFLQKKFIRWLGVLEAQVTVVAIHQNYHSSFPAKARAQAFQDCLQAVRKKGNSSNANVRYARYATSREGVSEIFSDGFGCREKPQNSSVYAYDHLNLVERILRIAPVDHDGLKDVLLCQVIWRKLKLVNFGSDQSYPSLGQYNLGIDNLSSPTRYIVWSTWSTHVNTYVLPEHVISFRALCYLRVRKMTNESGLDFRDQIVLSEGKYQQVWHLRSCRIFSLPLLSSNIVWFLCS
ncbi:hypothetical protein EUGRSUZ_G00207 [Eucalyptus grandis]|uniref:Uncharacterized protein n=2 Tax=Eucalyptus grandis TaxID=71139 RepID=A0ACC3JZD9_EUCGR|nr:hypothetical protein EUGRSUZ_G00207 [Eucalyptus grandis]